MTFHYAPAVRERVSLIIALAAASGGGKTRSALAIARGLAGGDDSRIAYIDTEAGRALHYAVEPGEKPNADRFAFMHGDLKAPFTPEAYADAIKAADDTGKFDVIVVDSCSHEWEGEGGLHDEHQDAVDDAVKKARKTAEEKGWRFDEQQAADRASIGAWKEPKRRHKRFVSRLLQCRAHLILCLRADEKLRIEQVKDERGRTKTVIVQPKDLPPAERWVPICEKRFMFEMTLSLILTPAAPGIPIPIKLQAQHRDAVPLDKQLSEETGRKLAAWAAGGISSPAKPTPAERAPSTADAAGDAAPLSPQNEGEDESGAAEHYIRQWNNRLDAVTSDAQLRQIGVEWNSDVQKETRRQLFDTQDRTLAALIARMRAALQGLSRTGETA